MGLVLAIAAKDLRQRLRDRSALLMAIVAPLLLAAGARVDVATLAQQAGASAAASAGNLQDSSSGGRTLRPAAYFGPGMALFFLFFTVGLGSRSLLSEGDRGTLARLRAAPIRPG